MVQKMEPHCHAETSPYSLFLFHPTCPEQLLAPRLYFYITYFNFTQLHQVQRMKGMAL